MKEHEQYLKISEFARLCRVTKDTLFHYEDIGILKPEIIKDNGYRYYAVKQYFTYEIIAILKETGTPLKEIKGYLEHPDAEHLVTLLSAKLQVLDDEQSKIERMKKILKNTINITNHTVRQDLVEPRLEEQKAQFIKTVGLSKEENEKERITKINTLNKYCLDHRLNEALPAGFIINKDNIIDGRYDSADFFFCVIDQSMANEQLVKKPKGKFAVIDHHGSYDTIASSFEKLKQFIEEKSLTVSGNAYVYELLGYLAVGDLEKYIVRISIEVM